MHVHMQALSASICPLRSTACAVAARNSVYVVEHHRAYRSLWSSATYSLYDTQPAYPVHLGRPPALAPQPPCPGRSPAPCPAADHPAPAPCPGLGPVPCRSCRAPYPAPCPGLSHAHAPCPYPVPCHASGGPVRDSPYPAPCHDPAPAPGRGYGHGARGHAGQRRAGPCKGMERVIHNQRKISYLMCASGTSTQPTQG